MSSDSGFKAGFGLIFVGGSYFFSSLKNFKLVRRMADTPTSKIASAAIGRNVEIVGKVVCAPDDLITSPLSGKKGYAFIWDLQKHVKRNKEYVWETQNLYYSSPYVYLTDGSPGYAALDLACCQFNDDVFVVGKAFTDRSFDIPNDVKDILRLNKLLDVDRPKGFFTTSDYRLREKVFVADELLYVIGQAHAAPATESSRVRASHHVFSKKSRNLKAKAQGLVEKLKGRSDIIQKFDRDKNQELDEAERDRLFLAVEKKLLEEYGHMAGNDYLPKATICFSLEEAGGTIFDERKVFVSKRPEKQVIGKKRFQAYLGLFGGPLLIVLGLYLLTLEFRGRE